MTIKNLPNSTYIGKEIYLGVNGEEEFWRMTCPLFQEKGVLFKGSEEEAIKYFYLFLKKKAPILFS